jgi:hypothetical protein
MRKHKTFKAFFITLILVLLLFLFLSHRLSYGTVYRTFENFDRTQLITEIASLQKNGVLTSESKVNPLPKMLTRLNVENIRMHQGHFYAVLDSFFMTETGFVVSLDENVTCKDFGSFYCKKLYDSIFYYHKNF